MLKSVAEFISIVFFPGTMVLIGMLSIYSEIRLSDWIWCILCIILIPLLQILIYKKLGWISDIYVKNRKQRWVPYFVLILLLTLCFRHLRISNASDSLTIWVAAILLVNTLLFLVNFILKASAHAAASAGMLGFFVLSAQEISLIILAAILWLAISISRKILNAHTIPELIAGSLLGFCCTFVAYHWIWN